MLFIFWKPALWHVGAKLLTTIGAENKNIEWLIYFPQGHLLTFNANWRFIRRRLEMLKIYNMDESVYCKLFLGPSRHLCPGNLCFHFYTHTDMYSITNRGFPVVFSGFGATNRTRFNHPSLLPRYFKLGRSRPSSQVLRGRDEGMWVRQCQNCTKIDPPGAAWYIPSFW